MSKFWFWEFGNFRAISPWENGSLLMDKAKLLMEKVSQPLRNVEKYSLWWVPYILCYIPYVKKSCLMYLYNIYSEFFVNSSSIFFYSTFFSSLGFISKVTIPFFSFYDGKNIQLVINLQLFLLILTKKSFLLFERESYSWWIRRPIYQERLKRFMIEDLQPGKINRNAVTI